MMKQHMGRKVAGLCLALFSTVVAVGAGARPAAAAGCYGSGCQGRNPMSYGCANDAYTIRYSDYKAESSASFRLEIRYSPSCRAAWGRITVWSGWNVGFGPSAWNPGGTSYGIVGGSGSTAWTGMINATPGRQVCVGTHFSVNGQWVRWYYLGCSNV